MHITGSNIAYDTGFPGYSNTATGFPSVWAPKSIMRLSGGGVGIIDQQRLTSTTQQIRMYRIDGTSVSGAVNLSLDATDTTASTFWAASASGNTVTLTTVNTVSSNQTTSLHVYVYDFSGTPSIVTSNSIPGSVAGFGTLGVPVCALTSTLSVACPNTSGGINGILGESWQWAEGYVQITSGVPAPITNVAAWHTTLTGSPPSGVASGPDYGITDCVALSSTSFAVIAAAGNASGSGASDGNPTVLMQMDLSGNITSQTTVPQTILTVSQGHVRGGGPKFLRGLDGSLYLSYIAEGGSTGIAGDPNPLVVALDTTTGQPSGGTFHQRNLVTQKEFMRVCNASAIGGGEWFVQTRRRICTVNQSTVDFSTSSASSNFASNVDPSFWGASASRDFAVPADLTPTGSIIGIKPGSAASGGATGDGPDFQYAAVIATSADTAVCITHDYTPGTTTLAGRAHSSVHRRRRRTGPTGPADHHVVRRATDPRPRRRCAAVPTEHRSGRAVPHRLPTRPDVHQRSRLQPGRHDRRRHDAHRDFREQLQRDGRRSARPVRRRPVHRNRPVRHHRRVDQRVRSTGLHAKLGDHPGVPGRHRSLVLRRTAVHVPVVADRLDVPAYQPCPVGVGVDNRDASHHLTRWEAAHGRGFPVTDRARLDAWMAASGDLLAELASAPTKESSMFVFDESWSKVDPHAAAAAGYTGGVVYCSYDRTGKNGQPPYIQTCLAAGLHVGLVWETFGQAPQQGAGLGAQEATDFVAQARALGASGGTLWMVAEDPTKEPPANWPGPVAYFGAAKPIINAAGFHLGAYGSEALVENLVANMVCEKRWYVGAWSQHITADLIQQNNSPGASTFGGTVDCNYAPAAGWGWAEFGTLPPPSPPPPPAAVPAPPPSAPAPPPPPNLSVDGVFGPATIRALQAAVGTTVDGIYGPASRVALQHHLGVTADGIVGPVTVRALQTRVGAAVDGVWGPATTRSLQAALNAHRF